MPLQDEIATLEEVAAALGRTAGWLRRHWLEIHREHGFPRKHPTGMTWPRQAVIAWLRGQQEPDAPAPANDNPVLSAEAAYEAALANRYGGHQ